MTLDEAITREEEVAKENQRVVDTGIVFDNVTIDMLYCDDTEVIEEHLANYQECAEEHRQLAEWLKDYKRLKEQESKKKGIGSIKFMEGSMSRVIGTVLTVIIDIITEMDMLSTVLNVAMKCLNHPQRK